MSMTAVCTGCRKSFRVPDAFAGKKVRCKQCGVAFRIPPAAATAHADVAPAVAAPVARTASAVSAARSSGAAVATSRSPLAQPASPSPDDDQGEYGLSDDDLGMHLNEAVAAARPYNPSAAAVVPASTAPAAASRGTTIATIYPSTGTTVSARNGPASAFEATNWLLWVQVGLFGLPLLLLLIGKLIEPIATPAILVSSLIGMAFMLWGQIGILMAAAHEGAVCVLLYMFLPFYPLYFILTRLEEVMPSLIRTIAGLGLMFGAIMMILSQSPA